MDARFKLCDALGCSPECSMEMLADKAENQAKRIQDYQAMIDTKNPTDMLTVHKAIKIKRMAENIIVTLTE